jgi:predicted KAP-like P-loop ATPase
MYADVLADFIRGCETPITIGIQGDWGIGKTSMLNMVKENLAPTIRSKVKYHVIYFNTWQYSQFQQEQYLGLSILKGIMAEVQSLESLKELRKDEKVKAALKNFGGFVAKLGNQVIQNNTGIDLINAATDDREASFLDNDIVVQIRRMKNEFSNLVKTLVPNELDRLVIMIDDLDRIKPVRALEFLESIKNFLDVESCVFVMAVDYSVIQSGMIEKLGRSAQELQGNLILTRSFRFHLQCHPVLIKLTNISCPYLAGIIRVGMGAVSNE